MNGKPKLSKEEAEQIVLDSDAFKTFYWLSCSPELLQMGFSKEEIQKALDKIKYNVSDLTKQEDFENGCYHQKAQLIKDTHRSNYIRVYKDVKIEGQYIQMEGYKSGDVKTFQIEDTYQGLKHEKVIRELLKKRFKWFNRFKWSIYELRGFDNYEIYLKTEKGTLYIPIMALLNKDFGLIRKRMTDYFSWFDKNKTQEDKEKSLEPLESKEARSLKRYLTKQ